MNISKSVVTAAGRKVSVLRAGPANGEAVLLVHGGRTGTSPIANGAHVWIARFHSCRRSAGHRH